MFYQILMYLSYFSVYMVIGYRFWKCFHLLLYLSIVRDKQALWNSMLFSSVMIVRIFSLFQFLGLSIWTSSWISFVLTMLVPGCSHVWKMSSYLFTLSWLWEIWVIKLLKMFHMFLTCVHCQVPMWPQFQFKTQLFYLFQNIQLVFFLKIRAVVQSTDLNLVNCAYSKCIFIIIKSYIISFFGV